MSALKDWLRGRIRPIARRDERIAELTRQLQKQRVLSQARQVKLGKARADMAELKQQSTAAKASAAQAQRESNRRVRSLERETKRLTRQGQRPSFQREIFRLRHAGRAARELGAGHASAFNQIPYKLRNYNLAASHGIRIPRVFQVAGRVEGLDLALAPKQFALKADGGAGGISVFLLEQTGSGLRTLVDHEPTTLEAIGAHMAELGPRRARPPFFIEEILTTANQRGAIPEDVKIFAAYGAILQVMVRTVRGHRDRDSFRYRFVTEAGEDLGQIEEKMKMDPDIALPESFTDMIAAAKHLSLAAGVPFCRVDLYDTPAGPVLGEITRAPGGDHLYLPKHDEFMGREIIRAQVRLESDLGAGRPVGALFGDQAGSGGLLGAGEAAGFGDRPGFGDRASSGDRPGAGEAAGFGGRTNADLYSGVELVEGISLPNTWPTATVACGKWCAAPSGPAAA